MQNPSKTNKKKILFPNAESKHAPSDRALLRLRMEMERKIFLLCSKSESQSIPLRLFDAMQVVKRPTQVAGLHRSEGICVTDESENKIQSA